MKALKLTIIGFVILINSITALSAQINRPSPEGRIGATKPFVKKDLTQQIGNPERKETQVQLEKQEKELNDMAVLGDGRYSKEETAIINNSKMIHETISK
jgi:hypothetical protein